MKKLLTTFAILAIIGKTYGQTSTANTTNLTISTSPAFSIADITPTLVQSPATPKSFALGVAQSTAQSGTGFPNNYSAEIAPIWWINPKGINVYTYLGIPENLPTKESPISQNYFSGLRFTTVSVAFINKDLIPDTSKSTQNIFSIGFHSTVLKIYNSSHYKKLSNDIVQWEADAQAELNQNQDILAQLARLSLQYADHTSDDYKAQKKKIYDNYKESKTPEVYKEINDLIAENPIFSWDVSAAWAMYGISNQTTKTGRAGIWTSLSSYIPLSKDAATKNYFNINILGRYLRDNFQLSDQGVITQANNFDIGFNSGFEFNRLNIAVESLYRYTNGIANTQNRTVGILSVKIADNVFVNGTFGKDFNGPNKLVSIFGINWGFGKEQVSLPINPAP